MAQPIYLLPGHAHLKLKSYALLPDHGYSFEQILADTTLHFVENDSLRPQETTAYWLKIKLASPSHYPERYRLRVRPLINHTLYYYDADSGTWQSATAGIMAAADKRFQQGNLPFMLQGGGVTNVLYVKMDVKPLQPFGHALQPELIITSQAVADNRERVIWISLMVSITVLLLFFLHNLYIYSSFRDKAILYYLVVQLGAMAYITVYKNFFYFFFNSKVFTMGLLANGSLHAYSYTNIVVHGSVVVIMFGFVQFTRLYLNTRLSLPRLDAVLRYGLYGYITASGLLILINVFVVFVDVYTLPYDNFYVFALIGAMAYTGVAAYRRKLPAAGPFLLANALPLACMLAVSLYHIFVKLYDTDTSLLPDLAVISQAFVFSVALVARMRLIQKELKAKEIEAQQLIYDIREIGLRHQLMVLENEQISANMLHVQTRNVLLQQKLETNQRELAANALYMLQKNKLLTGLQNQIQQMNKQFPGNTKPQGLQEMQSVLKNNLSLDGDWARFKLHFEQVHPRFFEDLQARHPSLTKNDIRFYAYFHINLSTKEIAALMNIDPASVRQAKARLNKKMGITATGE
jgi:DNA-binding CsgD family transcriptional regulator